MIRVCGHCGYSASGYDSKEEVMGCPQCNQMKFKVSGEGDSTDEPKEVVEVDKLKEFVNAKCFQPKDYKDDEMVVFVNDLKDFVNENVLMK